MEYTFQQSETVIVPGSIHFGWWAVVFARVYYKNYFKLGIIYIHNLLFNLNAIDSYHYFSNKIDKSNFLQWAGLRHSVPSHLKEISPDLSTISPSGLIGNKIFEIKDKKSKDYYSLLVSKKLNFQILSTNWRVILISQPNN